MNKNVDNKGEFKMLFDTIQNEIKDAMLTKNIVKRDCLRSIISEIKNQTVNAGKEITDEICIKVIQKSVKQHKDSIDSFIKGNRRDLAEKESDELKYIEIYIPKMLSEDETKAIISKILEGIDPIKKNMGLIMKQLPKDADRKTASKILSQILK